MRISDWSSDVCSSDLIDYQALEFDYRPVGQGDKRHPVVIVGAGPVGLSMALDLAQKNLPIVVIDDDYRLSTGSRAICFAKRTLDIWDRLGVGERMVQKGDRKRTRLNSSH